MHYPTFKDMMAGPETPNQRLLILALAGLTMQPPYTHQTPEDVYNDLVRGAKIIFGALDTVYAVPSPQERN